MPTVYGKTLTQGEIAAIVAAHMSAKMGREVKAEDIVLYSEGNMVEAEVYTSAL